MNKEMTISPRQIKEAIDKLLDKKEELQDEVYKLKEIIERVANDLDLILLQNARYKGNKYFISISSEKILYFIKLLSGGIDE